MDGQVYSIEDLRGGYQTRLEVNGTALVDAVCFPVAFSKVHTGLL